MIKFFKRIWRGSGYLEGYGHHPGWATFGIYILAAGLAGIKNGGLTDGFFGGCVIGLVALGPFFILGCWSRAVEYERDVQRTFNLLKKEYKNE